MASYVNQYGGYEKALAAYNAGPGTVNGAVRGCEAHGTILPYESAELYSRHRGTGSKSKLIQRMELEGSLASLILHGDASL